jgi:hypothetical protein
LRRFAAPLVALSLAAASPVRAHDPAVEVDTSGDLPPGITWDDVQPKLDRKADLKVVRSLGWMQGGLGHVAVFATATKTGQARGEAHTSRALYVTTLRMIGDTWKKIEDIREVVAPCALDLTADFVDGAIGVTDLDDDGEAELTFAYRFGCGGDVSPNTMKLIMLEGPQKYALRGESRVDPGNGVRVGGTFKPDFGKAPPAFLAHAKKVWEAHADEN